jgi:hypothetical protein
LGAAPLSPVSQEKGHYFVFFCVLLAIVYVLSRTGSAVAGKSCDEAPAFASSLGDFDIG